MNYNSRQNINYNPNKQLNYYSNPKDNNYNEQYASDTKGEFKPKGYNNLFIAILTVLYILFINKIAEMLSTTKPDDESKISNYVMMVYFISIMGLVIGYVWMTEQNNLIEEYKKNRYFFEDYISDEDKAKI